VFPRTGDQCSLGPVACFPSDRGLVFHRTKLFIGFCINRLVHSKDIHATFILGIQTRHSIVEDVHMYIQYYFLRLAFVRMAQIAMTIPFVVIMSFTAISANDSIWVCREHVTLRPRRRRGPFGDGQQCQRGR
jgi:hypothetical protein